VTDLRIGLYCFVYFTDASELTTQRARVHTTGSVDGFVVVDQPEVKAVISPTDGELCPPSPPAPLNGEAWESVPLAVDDRVVATAVFNVLAEPEPAAADVVVEPTVLQSEEVVVPPAQSVIDQVSTEPVSSSIVKSDSFVHVPAVSQNAVFAEAEPAGTLQIETAQPSAEQLVTSAVEDAVLVDAPVVPKAPDSLTSSPVLVASSNSTSSPVPLQLDTASLSNAPAITATPIAAAAAAATTPKAAVVSHPATLTAAATVAVTPKAAAASISVVATPAISAIKSAAQMTQPTPKAASVQTPAEPMPTSAAAAPTIPAPAAILGTDGRPISGVSTGSELSAIGSDFDM